MPTTLLKNSAPKTFEAMKGAFNYKNVMQAPRLVKVVVSSGIGSVKDKNKIKVIEDRLQKITGQKVAPRAAKKSIATFKLREGETVGFMVTIRGKRMKDFVDKLVNVVLPRTRDFRGLEGSSIDEMGNLTIGIKEHTIFPETSEEDLKDVFGLAITVVTTAKTREEAKAFFEHLGFPIKK